MNEYYQVAYWLYLMPALVTFCFGMLAIERGKMPVELTSRSRYASYLGLMMPSLFPFLNMFFALGFVILNLRD